MFSFIKKIFTKKKKTTRNLKMIVAIDEKNGIGKNGDLLFSLKEDMKHFTNTTIGGVVIMGSTTYESIPKRFRPLKDRINIVLNHNEKEYPDENIFIVHSITGALEKALNYNKDVWVIGGASIYQQMLPFANELEITQIFTLKNADTFFPVFKNDFELIKKSEKMFSEKENIEFQFQTWKRK